MKIRFLGGARTVTGSCFYVVGEKEKILIDCGMYQGPDAEEVNKRGFDFTPSEIDCLFLTHSHLDHVGLVPKLVKEGFRGKIITTSAAGKGRGIRDIRLTAGRSTSKTLGDIVELLYKSLDIVSPHHTKLFRVYV